MKTLLEIFSTRELALLFWIAVIILLSFLSLKLTKSFLGIVKAFFARKIIQIFLLYNLYVALIVFILERIDLLDKNLIKDTTLWYFSVGFILFLKLNNAKSIRYFREIIFDSIKWIIILEYLVNFYTFGFWTEIICMPIIFSLVLTQFYTELGKTEQDKAISANLKNTLNFIGLIIFVYVLYMTIVEFKQLLTINNLKSFLLPPLLTILYIPFLYLAALFMQYEELFVSIRNYHLVRPETNVKREIFKVALLNLNKVSAIKKGIRKFDYRHAEDSLEYVKGLAVKSDKILK